MTRQNAKISERISAINRINTRQIKALAKNTMTDNQDNFARIAFFQQLCQADKRAAAVANIIHNKARFAFKISFHCLKTRQMTRFDIAFFGTFNY